MTTFDKVYAAVRLIPRGSVATYGQIAAAIGNKRLARVVGYALHVNPEPGLPKDDDEHKAIRRGAVQASFRNCTLVPLTMMEICSEAIDLCAGLVGTTNPNVVSDLGIAALTLKTAMESAWLNVLINLSSLKDKAFRDECCQKGEALLAHAVPIAQESYEKVIKVITEK